MKILDAILKNKVPMAQMHQIQVNDLYLGAYLLQKGADLTELHFNEQSRATLIFTGIDIERTRMEYDGSVQIHIPTLKRNYNKLKDTIYHYKDKHHHPKGIKICLYRNMNSMI